MKTKPNLHSMLNVERWMFDVDLLLPLLLLLLLPVAVQAQFNYTTNNGTITITGYTGPGGAVTIPSTITGLPVTGIGGYAFYNQSGLTSIASPVGTGETSNHQPLEL